MKTHLGREARREKGLDWIGEEKMYGNQTGMRPRVNGWGEASRRVLTLEDKAGQHGHVNRTARRKGWRRREEEERKEGRRPGRTAVTGTTMGGNCIFIYLFILAARQQRGSHVVARWSPRWSSLCRRPARCCLALSPAANPNVAWSARRRPAMAQ